jgi:RNA polymerase sigma-70 factor (ECF subfamily)
MLEHRQPIAAMTRKGGPISQNSDRASAGLQSLLLAQRPDLLRFLAARRAAPDEAEDLLQDLFVKLAGQNIGPVAEPRAYLYRMLDNLLLDRRRSAGRRAGREQAWSAAQGGAAPEVDERPSAERELIDRERLALVSAALEVLPERTLFAFRRFRIDGSSQKEIAAEIGISVSAVEKHLQRAYRALADVQARLDEEVAPSRRL